MVAVFCYSLPTIYILKINRMDHFNYNGKIFKEHSLIIGADNRGLRYGDGLFETLKIKNGEIILEDEHFARLWNGMLVLQFEVPKHFTPEKLKKEIEQLVIKNNHQHAARVRINIIRGDGGLYDAKNHTPNYIIQTWALPENNGNWNSNGLVAGIFEDAKKSCDTISNLKHNNYLPYVLAALKAKKEKWNDAILLNTHDRICDSTIANIFLIKEGIILTPSLKEGCVAGIMRKQIIKEAIQNNWPLKETEITREDILAAEEVFFSNSIYTIRWVQRIGDSTYKNSFTQKIFDALFTTI